MARTRPTDRSWSLLLGARTAAGRTKSFSKADDRRLQDITTRHFPHGYTILQAAGGWFDPQHAKFVREESRQIMVCNVSRVAMLRWAREVGEAFQQKELMVVELGRGISLKIH